ncbi:MAG: hypothetical protein U0168_24150 [Nannocystaceae bacterium]
MITDPTRFPPAADAARIAAELAAMGEPPLPPDEGDAAALEPDAAVRTLFALVHPRDPGVTLDELGRARAWRRVAMHRAAVTAPVAPRPGRLLRAAWLLVATAAAVVLVPALGARVHDRAPAGERESTAALGEQARHALEALPGSQDQARARSLAQTYNARMRGGQP